MSGTSLTADQMNSIAQDQATKVRVVRKVLQPVIGQGYVDSVPGYRVIKGPSLSLRPNQHLRPLQMARHFSLHKEQINDGVALSTLISFAAADIAQCPS
jgi:hypothetical protein